MIVKMIIVEIPLGNTRKKDRYYLYYLDSKPAKHLIQH